MCRGIALTVDLLPNIRKEAMSREVERKDKSLRRFYSVGEIEAITSLSRATIYRKMAQGTFPTSVPISAGRVGWDRLAVDEWCEGRLAARKDKR
jgi:prophage regulatory protein